MTLIDEELLFISAKKGVQAYFNVLYVSCKEKESLDRTKITDGQSEKTHDFCDKRIILIKQSWRVSE